jgi:ribosomal protein S18 acetylase RimI-like enzyme
LTIEEKHAHTQIYMLRPTFGGLPDAPLPPPFAIRDYRPGDEAAWLRIFRLAEEIGEAPAGLFVKELGDDEEELRKRALFLCDGNGEEIGAITAWHNTHYDGMNWGRVHWASIVPAFQGRQLAKPLLTACLGRMIELGCDGVYLLTEPPRVAAVNLYFRYGFSVDVRSEIEREAWEMLLDRVKPEFRAQVEEGLARYTERN